MANVASPTMQRTLVEFDPDVEIAISLRGLLPAQRLSMRLNAGCDPLEAPHTLQERHALQRTGALLHDHRVGSGEFRFGEHGHLIVRAASPERKSSGKQSGV